MEGGGAGRLQLDSYVAELEAVWLAFEELYGGLSPDDWGRRYGKHWTFADQPFHLTYFDRVMVAGRWCALHDEGIAGRFAGAMQALWASGSKGQP